MQTLYLKKKVTSTTTRNSYTTFGNDITKSIISNYSINFPHEARMCTVFTLLDIEILQYFVTDLIFVWLLCEKHFMTENRITLTGYTYGIETPVFLHKIESLEFDLFHCSVIIGMIFLLYFYMIFVILFNRAATFAYVNLSATEFANPIEVLIFIGIKKMLVICKTREMVRLKRCVLDRLKVMPSGQRITILRDPRFYLLHHDLDLM